MKAEVEKNKKIKKRSSAYTASEIIQGHIGEVDESGNPTQRTLREKVIAEFHYEKLIVGWLYMALALLVIYRQESFTLSGGIALALLVFFTASLELAKFGYSTRVSDQQKLQHFYAQKRSSVQLVSSEAAREIIGNLPENLPKQGELSKGISVLSYIIESMMLAHSISVCAVAVALVGGGLLNPSAELSLLQEQSMVFIQMVIVPALFYLLARLIRTGEEKKYAETIKSLFDTLDKIVEKVEESDNEPGDEEELFAAEERLAIEESDFTAGDDTKMLGRLTLR